MGQGRGRLLPRQHDEFGVHHGRAVVRARIEEGVGVDPTVQVHHAQRGRCARRHVSQRTGAGGSVQQDLVAEPGVQHRYDPGLAVDDGAQGADGMTSVQNLVEIGPVVAGAFGVTVDLIERTGHAPNLTHIGLATRPVSVIDARPVRKARRPDGRRALRHISYELTVAARCGSFQSGRGKWQVYPSGYRSR